MFWGSGRRCRWAFFALAFCPVSAVCFFGSLFALLSSTESRIVLPSVYGLGTALPVVAFAVLIAVSARAVGKAFHVLTQIVWWVQRAAGVVCLVLGSYFAWKYILAAF